MALSDRVPLWARKTKRAGLNTSGDLYIYRKDMYVVGLDTTVQGSKLVHREPREHNWWGLTAERMLGKPIAGDSKYCVMCGNTRPTSYFNDRQVSDIELAFLAGLLILESRYRRPRTAPTFERLARKALRRLHPMCRECQRKYDPESLGLQYCARCAQNKGETGWIEGVMFSSDKAKYCRYHEAARKADYRMRKAYELRVA